MLTKISNALSFFAGVCTGFFRRWKSKGFRSGCIFVRVALLNYWVHQGNKLSRRIPSLQRVECPCCGWRGYDFEAHDTVKFWLPSVGCPGCGSHERQRMLYTYIHRHDPALLNTAGRLLHFAAEADVRKMFAHNTRLKYFSTDYDINAVHARSLPGTRFLADIQNLAVPTDTFDIIFCLHVLEHVRRDRDAIKELHRALKPGGVAYIMVPFDMTLAQTEEWEIPDPDIHYHIWAYATSDFKHRLGVFDFKEIKPDTFLSPEERIRFRIPPKEIIYRCVKQVPAPKSAETSHAAHASA